MGITDLITEVLVREGWDKYTNDPDDRGGPTKWGITIGRWSDYIGREATELDVQLITELQARTFYLLEYVNRPHFDMIENEFLRELVVDCGVNHGVTRAAKWLQRAVGARQDGKVGPRTLEAVNSARVERTYLRIAAYRVKFYGQIVRRDRTQAKFIGGWNNRAADFILAAAKEFD